MTHTPGPWVWHYKSGALHRVGEPPYSYGTAVLYPTYEYETGTDTIVSDADADLIAAAPDLVQAGVEIDRLSLVIESAVRQSDPINYAAVLSALMSNRAVIAKARGDAPDTIAKAEDV